MKILTKSLLSAGAAAAALVTVAAPAQARGRDNDGITAGEVIAGAIILGGIAAVISSSDNDRDYRYDDGRYNDRGYNDRGYNDGRYNDGRYNDRDDGYNNERRGRGYDDYRYNSQRGSRAAVNQCINTVEQWASRYSRANVTHINNIDRTRTGYRITGKLVLQDGYRGRSRYDRGYDRGYDQGRFTCYVERGRVIDVDYRGLDQWR